MSAVVVVRPFPGGVWMYDVEIPPESTYVRLDSDAETADPDAPLIMGEMSPLYARSGRWIGPTAP
jgi:hypothetical protein